MPLWVLLAYFVPNLQKAFAISCYSCTFNFNDIFDIQDGNYCILQGYGAHQVTCAECCTKDLCNNDTSVQYYYKILSKQYTDWETPLATELKFNKKHNLKFPYKR
ncbi:hypothetical protein M3Y97_00263100 [Aphelenchoides bicaudatus]|nr:hypothetical protein M3Y97_00263100 [Aphelenchoides bicaudatus]